MLTVLGRLTAITGVLFPCHTLYSKVLTLRPSLTEERTKFNNASIVTQLIPICQTLNSMVYPQATSGILRRSRKEVPGRDILWTRKYPRTKEETTFMGGSHLPALCKTHSCLRQDGRNEIAPCPVGGILGKYTGRQIAGF